VSAPRRSLPFSSTNLPEAIASTTGLRASDWHAGKLFGMRFDVALAAGLLTTLGFGVAHATSVLAHAT